MRQKYEEDAETFERSRDPLDEALGKELRTLLKNAPMNSSMTIQGIEDLLGIHRLIESDSGKQLRIDALRGRSSDGICRERWMRI